MIDRVGQSARRLAAFSIAVAIACGHTGAAMAAAPEAPVDAPLQLGKSFRDAIAGARRALAEQDRTGLRNVLAAARSRVTTADEQYIVDQYDLALARLTGDRTAMMAAFDRLIASGSAARRLTRDDQARYQVSLGEIAFQSGNFARAERAFLEAQATGHRDPQAAILLAESQIRGGRMEDAVKAIWLAVESTVAAGQKPPVAWFARGAEVASRARLPGAYAAITSAWVASYPNRETWYIALAGFRQIGGLSADADRDLLRLARACGAAEMFSLKDYLDYVQLLAPLSLNDAVSLVREGISSGQIAASESPAIAKLLLKVDPRLAAERKRLAANAGTLSGPVALVARADALYGIGEFAKAADLYRRALTLPGADDGPGNVRLAAALARAGDKAGAIAALDAVTGGTHAPIALYWRTLINSR